MKRKGDLARRLPRCTWREDLTQTQVFGSAYDGRWSHPGRIRPSRCALPFDEVAYAEYGEDGENSRARSSDHGNEKPVAYRGCGGRQSDCRYEKRTCAARGI